MRLFLALLVCVHKVSTCFGATPSDDGVPPPKRSVVSRQFEHRGPNLNPDVVFALTRHLETSSHPSFSAVCKLFKAQSDKAYIWVNLIAHANLPERPETLPPKLYFYSAIKDHNGQALLTFIEEIYRSSAPKETLYKWLVKLLPSDAVRQKERLQSFSYHQRLWLVRICLDIAHEYLEDENCPTRIEAILALKTAGFAILPSINPNFSNKENKLIKEASDDLAELGLQVNKLRPSMAPKL